MKPAADACVIDTTGLPLEHVITRIAQEIRDRLHEHPEARRRHPIVVGGQDERLHGAGPLLSASVGARGFEPPTP